MKSVTETAVEMLKGLLERAQAIVASIDRAERGDRPVDDLNAMIRQDTELASRHLDLLERRKTQLREEDFRAKHGRPPGPGELEGGKAAETKPLSGVGAVDSRSDGSASHSAGPNKK